MSTRSTTHFVSNGRTDAIIYRHSDGYPEGHGKDLQRFFADVEAQTGRDTRFTDTSYLAAKLVVWLAGLFAPYSQPYEPGEDYELSQISRKELAKDAPLNFLGVGVLMQDNWDIEYRYVVDCGSLDETGRPSVTCYAVGGAFGHDPTYHETPIPA